MKRFRKMAALILMVIFAINLCACGEKGSKVKDYAGYYIYEDPEDSYGWSYRAMEIDKDGQAVFRVREHHYQNPYWNFARIGITSGTISVEENKGIVYNTNFEGTDDKINWSYCFPLKLTLLNDGNEIHVDSDSGDWNAFSFSRVTEKDYETFCDEHELYIDTKENKAVEAE